MTKSKKFILITIALAAVFFIPLLAADPVAAQASKEEACKALGGAWAGGECSVGGDQPDIETTIANLINIMSIIAGITAVIMIIISGFRFITANGDSNTVSAARRTLMYALVGVVVVALSQTIVWFVLGGIE
jgi:cytochrome bd-type quinol oxidase subunit 2